MKNACVYVYLSCPVYSKLFGLWDVELKNIFSIFGMKSKIKAVYRFHMSFFFCKIEYLLNITYQVNSEYTGWKATSSSLTATWCKLTEHCPQTENLLDQWTEPKSQIMTEVPGFVPAYFVRKGKEIKWWIFNIDCLSEHRQSKETRYWIQGFPEDQYNDRVCTARDHRPLSTFTRSSLHLASTHATFRHLAAISPSNIMSQPLSLKFSDPSGYVFNFVPGSVRLVFLFWDQVWWILS